MKSCCCKRISNWDMIKGWLSYLIEENKIITLVIESLGATAICIFLWAETSLTLWGAILIYVAFSIAAICLQRRLIPKWLTFLVFLAMLLFMIFNPLGVKVEQDHITPTRDPDKTQKLDIDDIRFSQ